MAGTRQEREYYTCRIVYECITRKVHESEQVRTSTKWLRIILDSKYEKGRFKFETKLLFQHLTEKQSNELIKLLQKFEELLMEYLVPGKQIQLVSN